jgi:hypothetical protein
MRQFRACAQPEPHPAAALYRDHKQAQPLQSLLDLPVVGPWLQTAEQPDAAAARPGQHRPYAKCVLRLPDASSGRYEEVRSSRPGLLRVSAHLRPTAAHPDWTGVRVLLVADLLARVAELRGLQVLTVVVFPGDPAAEQGYAERTAGLLDIHPPGVRTSSAAAPAVLGGQPDVHIAGPGSSAGERPGLVTLVGGIRVRTTGSGEGADLAAEAIPAAADPLAMRLALMSHPSDHAADIDDSALASACDLITQWRDQVAEWAESPSRPMPPHIRSALDAAFGDLDTPTALQLLTGLAAEVDVPEGARFETFAFADRVLGLELARQVGRPRR